MPDVEPMDEEGVLDALNAALPMQARSALSYTLVGGSLTGFDLQHNIGLGGAAVVTLYTPARG